MKKFFLIIVFGLVSYTAWVQESSPSQKMQQQITREFQKNNYKQVIHLYEDFVSHHSDHDLPLVMKTLYSQSLADVGDLDRAIEVLKGLLSDFSTQVDPIKLHYDLANLLFIQKKHAEAQVHYQKVLILASHHDEIISKVRGRLRIMKGKEGRKKDVISLQLLDIETVLEAGEIPEGSREFLAKACDEKPDSPNSQKAKILLAKIQEMREVKAKGLLDEARRLFDQEKKYLQVSEILSTLMTDYADVAEKHSVEVLQKAVEGRSRFLRSTKPDTLPAQESTHQ